MNDTDESYIAYCGRFCGDCIIRKGEIADHARALLLKLDEEGFGKIAEELSDLLIEFAVFSRYREFIEALQALDILRCKDICRKGGGTAACRIRECCTGKGIDGCWECMEFEECELFDWLNPVIDREDNIRNLKLIKEKGKKALLAQKKK